MRTTVTRIAFWILIALIVAVIAGCAAGNVRYAYHPAGFWAGLWHGAISLVTFIISCFSDTVHMYERNNTGEWYDGGFLLGALIVWGGVFRSSHSGRRKPRKRERERERDDIGERIEESIRRGFEDCGRSNKDAEEWKEIAAKIEEKVKRELRDWTNR